MVKRVALGDVLTLKKQHPCGNWQWRVVRLGSDIGIRCVGCQRYILMGRTTLEKSIRATGDSDPEDEIVR